VEAYLHASLEITLDGVSGTSQTPLVSSLNRTTMSHRTGLYLVRKIQTCELAGNQTPDIKYARMCIQNIPD
jgi:hypothetical protein